MIDIAAIYQANLDAAKIAKFSANINSMSTEIAAIAHHPDYRHMTLDNTTRVKTFSYTYTIANNTINLIIGRSTEYRNKNAFKIKAIRKETAISQIRKTIETEIGHKLRLQWKNK